MMGEESNPLQRVWGFWSEQSPPQYGNPLLLSIRKEIHPLLIVDPFRYFHDGDEDSPTAMAPAMQYLRKMCGVAESVRRS